MTRADRILFLVVCPLLFASCAVGSRVVIHGEPSRPAHAARAPMGGTQVVVADFDYSAVEPGVVGRDFDQVRPIVWDGKPGKAMADLVAAVLAENGVGAVRAAAEGQAPETAPLRISGQLRRFEVNARRPGGLNVITTGATVSIFITASGGSLFVPWESSVSSSTSMKDLFVTPDDARDALFSSANAVAEEAVRRLLEAGVVAPPQSGK